MPKRAINVDGVRVEGAEARRMLREAFFEAVKQTGISIRRVRMVAMLIGGVLGGAVAVTSVLIPAWRNASYAWVYLGVAFVVLAVTARIIARRVLWWVYRHEIRLAMQRLGFELCVECGYWLKGLPEDEPRCPECGSERRRLGA